MVGFVGDLATKAEINKTWQYLKISKIGSTDNHEILLETFKKKLLILLLD